MLRPTFYSFETAKRALASSQMGLDTVGHNISNVNTPGYTRQRVDQVTFDTGSYRAKFASYGYQFPGQGAEVSGINQVRDPYLDRRFRTEAAKVGELSTTSDGLDKINRIFDEITKTGSHAKMGEFLTQLDALIASADSPEQATILKSKAQDLARILNANSIDLANAAVQQQGEMESSVNEINVLLEQIADLNVKIKEDNFYGNPSNKNNDDRNMYIDRLAELIDIEITRTPVKVTNDLSVESVKISIRGSHPEAVLVDSGFHNSIGVKYTNPLKPNKDPDQYEYLDEVSYHLIDGLTNLPIIPEGRTDSDITKDIMTGVLKGHLDIMNGQGFTNARAGDNTFRGIPYTQQSLDDYARVLADVMNKLNAIQVYNPADPNAVNGFTTIPRDLFVASGDTGDVTEFIFMGSAPDPDNPGKFIPQVQARQNDGTIVDASGWNTIDPATGNVLGFDGLPIAGVNVKDFERKLGARNIAASQDWQNDPLHITREQRNNALTIGTVAGETGLILANGSVAMSDGPPKTAVTLGRDPGQVSRIGSGGRLLDVNGDEIMVDGKPLTLDALERVMTEEADAPVTFEDYFAGGVLGTSLDMKYDTQALTAADFSKKGAEGAPAAPPSGAVTDWTVDAEGYLLDTDGDRVYLNSDTKQKAVNITDLVLQKPEAHPTQMTPANGYDRDFSDYFPGGKVAEPLTFVGPNDANGDPTREYHYPEDFVTVNPDGTYTTAESFNGWSFSTGTPRQLLDSNNKPVYLIDDIVVNSKNMTLYTPPVTDPPTPPPEYSNPPILKDYLTGGVDGTIKLNGVDTHASDLGPGKYTDFAGFILHSDGSLRDPDGNRVFSPKPIPAANETPITEADMEPRYTRTAPAVIGDYLNGTNLIQKQPNERTTYTINDFQPANGSAFVDSDAADGSPFTGWSIDSEGYIIAPTDDPNNPMQRVSLKDDPNTKLKASDLVQINHPKLQPGDVTPNDLLPGEKANGNLDQMKIALNDKDRIFPNGFKGNFQEYIVGFQEDMANDKQTTDSLLSGSINVLSGLADSRDAISAVSIDEEGISMMTYQSYYNAAARYMTTLDEALDKIINGMGLVGR